MISFELSDIDNLKSIFTFISELSHNVNMNFNPNGLEMLVMDSTKTCMSKAKLTKKYFNVYNCNNETVVGIDCLSFVKILKMCDNESELTGKYEYKDYIDTVSVGKHVTKLKLKLLDLDVDNDITDLGYKTSILTDMEQVCSDLNNIGFLVS